MKKIFILWISYMVLMFFYSEYKQSRIISSVKPQSRETLFLDIPQDVLRAFNSTDSLSYVYNLFIKQSVQLNILVEDAKRYYSFKNRVLLPMSFPLRMVTFLSFILLMAYFVNRNKDLIRNKIATEYETKYRNIELQNSMLLLAKRNEDIDSLVVQLNHLQKDPTKAEVALLIAQLKKETIIESNWKNYLISFEKLHPTFYATLEQSNISLTASEKRLCAFIFQNLTINQIAAIVHVNPNSVEKSRFRLRKKLALNKEQNLNNYIQNL